MLRKLISRSTNWRSSSQIALLMSHRNLSQQSHEQICFNNEKVKMYLENLRQEFYENQTGSSPIKSFARINKLSTVVQAIEQRGVLMKNLDMLSHMDSEKDEDMIELVEEERNVYSNFLRETEEKLLKQLLLLGDDETCSSLIFEITAGVGGREAMLFASELYSMYSNFISSKGWDYELLEEDRNDSGSLRHANLIIYGDDSYNMLKFEAGVHRVQRVPSTEKSGRIHTSTISVAIIPRPRDIDVSINEKDLKIETKRASGAGGQHVNTTDSAVRIVHIPTGIAIESQTERSQYKNKEIAMTKLKAKLYQQQFEAQEATTHSIRKLQRGTSNRNEKIRTYNFVQDRITDHRIPGGTMHNLKEFLAGGNPFVTMINLLIENNQRTELLNTIENIASKTAPIEQETEDKIQHP